MCKFDQNCFCVSWIMQWFQPITLACKKTDYKHQYKDYQYKDYFSLMHSKEFQHTISLTRTFAVSNSSSSQRCFIKKLFLKISQKNKCWSLFLIKLQTFRAATFLRKSNRGVFMGILQNFQEHLFWRTSVNGYIIVPASSFLQ